MIRTLDRLIAGTYLRLFTIFIIGAPLLFILVDAVDNLDRYFERGLSLTQVTTGYLYLFPNFLLWAFPVASLLATVFTIYPMTVHREVMASKAGGISFYRLITPIVILGVFLTGFAVWFSQVVPRTNQIAAEVLGERERRQEWRSNFVYITDAGESLTARRLNSSEGEMLNVTVQSFSREPETPTRHIEAQQVIWTGGERWVFYDGWIREVFPDGREDATAFEEYTHEALHEAPEDLLETVRKEEEMTYAELGVLADRILRSGGDPGRVLTKREQQLAIPVATLVIILFGAPLATSSRRGGTAFGIGVSLATTILYLMLFRVSGAMGYTGTLSPLAAAWIPNGIFLFGGLVLLWRVRT